VNLDVTLDEGDIIVAVDTGQIQLEIALTGAEALELFDALLAAITTAHQTVPLDVFDPPERWAAAGRIYPFRRPPDA